MIHFVRDLVMVGLFALSPFIGAWLVVEFRLWLGRKHQN